MPSPEAAPSQTRGWGSLTGVGVGPGDPELLTLKAVLAIQAADVIFAPVRRDGERSMALEVVHERIDACRQRVVTLSFPERGGGGAWRERCRPIVDALRGGHRAVFLTEGDPSLYSSFDDARRAVRSLAPEATVDVIPGVSSITAAAGAAGLSLADAADGLAIVPATGPEGALEGALLLFPCVVIVKLGRAIRPTIELLERLDLLDQAVYVRRCGWPEQQVVRDLRAARDELPPDYFALIIVRRRGPA